MDLAPIVVPVFIEEANNRSLSSTDMPAAEVM